MIQKLRMNFGSIYLMTGRGSLLVMSDAAQLTPCNHSVCHKGSEAVDSLYSSSRLVTLCLSRVCLPASEKFERGEVGEGLMGPYTVVGFLPASQLLVERGQLIGVGLHFIEFLIVGAVGALHMGVQFR